MANRLQSLANGRPPRNHSNCSIARGTRRNSNRNADGNEEDLGSCIKIPEGGLEKEKKEHKRCQKKVDTGDHSSEFGNSGQGSRRTIGVVLQKQKRTKMRLRTGIFFIKKGRWTANARGTTVQRNCGGSENREIWPRVIREEHCGRLRNNGRSGKKRGGL